ncbi:MAG TPA: polysaccharide deacetylase family protein [Candidatus Acidoferrales bacterium]|nr:polysaccharide deacetylase family protein [Candidatus Acidoferrales bacterium]
MKPAVKNVCTAVCLLWLAPARSATPFPEPGPEPAAEPAAEPARTEIMKWQDGKDACISLTFDDSSINQFRIDMPLLNERGMPGTFFIETGAIQGSRNQPAFVGRPIMDIIRESAKAPTSKDNALERTSMLNYLQTVQHVPELADFSAQRLGRFLRQANYAELGRAVDAALAKLRETGATYVVSPRKSPAGDRRYGLTWDEMRRHAAEGHEIANHSISHPFMPALDEANIVYEIEKSNEDIREQLGAKHTFSVEAPYGIDDPRVRPIVSSRFPLTRNWVTDGFMDGFLRDDSRDPAISSKEYVQWQRGPLARTSLDTMTTWVDKSIGHGFWLVLVFHGIEGIGWEALPTEEMRTYVDYIKEHEGHLWIATFQDGAKYARERVASSVRTSATGDAIEVTVTHSLDSGLYDLALTARTIVPADWRVVRFRQGDDVRWLPIHREGGEPFVMYRITPNGKAATLEKGLN